MMVSLEEPRLERSLLRDPLKGAQRVKIFTPCVNAFQRSSSSQKDVNARMFKMTYSVDIIHTIFPTNYHLSQGYMNTVTRTVETEILSGLSLTKTDFVTTSAMGLTC